MNIFIPGISRLNITSGNRTYRIPSPTRPALISRNAFHPSSASEPVISGADVTKDLSNEKGFYISLDDDQPRRPKPPLRTKRGSPKKERSFSSDIADGRSFVKVADTPVSWQCF